MIDYQAPPICEGDFTSTGTSTISLLPILRPSGPTGLVMNWNGTRYRLEWGIIPGALCYSVYRLNDVLDPFSEWILVAECITGNNITLPPGIYGVTVITLDGESDPSEPIEGPAVDPADPPPVVPDPPAECPAEVGTETPSDLMIEEDTDLGLLTPDPFAAAHTENWGSFPQAMYEISYVEGAFKDETNPNPYDFKLGGNEWIWDGGGDSFDPLLGAGIIGRPSQAEVEAEVASRCATFTAYCSLQFIHDGGTIGVSNNRFGTPEEPTAGSPNPTWQLKRVGTWPSYPSQLRIVDYDESKFTPVADCNALGSGQPSWSGTFNTKSVFLPFIFTWLSSEAVSTTINGKLMVEAKVTHWTSNPNTATGAGWLLWIFFINDDGVIDAWTGIKNVGTQPTGTYYRDSGCCTGPGCLTLESY
jgi:hypothetical protein